MGRKIAWQKVTFYCLLCLYAAALIFLAVKLNVWEDEAYSLNTTSNPLAKVVTQAYNFEGQPAGYFLLLAIWRKLNSSIFFARLFSIVFTGFSSFLFYKVSRLLSGDRFSKWMLVIFLLNPFTVWAALEIRLYAFVIFLSLFLIYCFIRYYRDKERKYLYFFLTVALIGLYTQYFIALEIFTLGIVLLVFRGWKTFFQFCIFLLPVVVLFLPNLFIIHQQVAMLQSHKETYTMFRRVSVVLHAPQEILLGLQIVPFKVAANRVIRVLFIALSGFGYYQLSKTRVSNSFFRNINAILLGIMVLIFSYCALIGVSGIIFQMKYLAVGSPLILLIILLFKALPEPLNRLVYVAISLYYIGLLAFNYRRPIKNYNYVSAGKFAVKIARNKEPLLFYNKSILPAFSYYYTGKNHLFPLPALNYDRHYYEEDIFDTSELKKEIQKVNSPTHSYLLFTNNSDGFKYNLKMNQAIIDTFLKSNYTVTFDTTFLGENKNHSLRLRRLEFR